MRRLSYPASVSVEPTGIEPATSGYRLPPSRIQQEVKMKRFLSLLVVVLAVVVVAVAAPKKPADHGLFTPDQISWMNAPNALPAGAKLAVLEGDPFKSGLYTMRLSMPAGYEIPPHFHK